MGYSVGKVVDLLKLSVFCTESSRDLTPELLGECSASVNVTINYCLSTLYGRCRSRRHCRLLRSISVYIQPARSWAPKNLETLKHLACDRYTQIPFQFQFQYSISYTRIVRRNENNARTVLNEQNIQSNGDIPCQNEQPFRFSISIFNFNIQCPIFPHSNSSMKREQRKDRSQRVEHLVKNGAIRCQNKFYILIFVDRVLLEGDKLMKSHSNYSAVTYKSDGRVNSSYYRSVA